MKAFSKAPIFLVLLGFTAVDPARAVDPVIHVAWDGGGTPILDAHYSVRTLPPASPEFPDVELIAGNLTWRVWSKDADNPDGVGDIGVISSPAAQNFAVRTGERAGHEWRS